MAETLAQYNVILELLTETKGVDSINKTVGGMQKNMQAAQKTFAEIISKDIVNDAVKGLETLRKKIAETGKGANLEPLLDEMDKLVKKADITEEEFKQLEKVSEELGRELARAIPNAAGDFGQLADAAEETTTKFTSAKAELRELTKQITSGQLEGKQLDIARARAAALTDEIGDVREQIRNMSSDTRGLDTLIEGTRAVTAGFSIAEGAAALFGDESEDVQKALVKLNGIMAIQNGLQEAHALLLQNSNLKMRALSIAQALYSVVVGTSTGALKIFRIALASTGIGLLVIALGALVANWDKVKKSISENSQAIFDFGKKVTLLVPPLNILVKAAEYVYNNFDNIKTAIFGIDDAIGAFLKTVGTIAGSLAGGDFGEAYAAYEKIGENTVKAFRKGQSDEIANQKLNSLADTLVKNNKRLQREADLLDAKGLDSFEKRKKIITNELNILRIKNATEEELADKENELQILIAEREKENADKRQKAREAATKKAEDEQKKALEASLERAEKNYELLRKQALIEIKDKEKLDTQLKKLELEKQIAIATIKEQYAKAGTSDAIALQNEILEIERQYNELLRGAKVESPEKLLNRKATEEILKNARTIGEAIQNLKLNIEFTRDPEQKIKLQNELDNFIEQLTGKDIEKKIQELQDQIEITFNPKIKLDLEKQKKQLETELAFFKSPEFRKNLFIKDGTSVISVEDLLPEDQVQAMKDRLKKIQDTLENFKPTNVTELKSFEALKSEADQLKDYLDKLAGEDKESNWLQRLVGLDDEQYAEFIGKLDRAKETLKQSLDTIIANEIEQTDKQIELQEKRVSSAEKNAEKGKVKQLEIEEERLNKLQEKREKYVKAQRALAQLEILQANAVAAAKSIQAISEAFAAGGPAGIITGIATAIALAAQIAAIVSTVRNSFGDLPAFIDGTELVGADPRFTKYRKAQGQDGYVARFDGRERIVDPKINAQLGSIPNHLLPDAVKLYKLYPAISNIKNNQNNADVVDAIRDMKESIEAIKMNVKLDKAGFVAEVEKLIQRRVERKRFVA